MGSISRLSMPRLITPHAFLCRDHYLDSETYLYILKWVWSLERELLGSRESWNGRNGDDYVYIFTVCVYENLQRIKKNNESHHNWSVYPNLKTFSCIWNFCQFGWWHLTQPNLRNFSFFVSQAKQDGLLVVNVWWLLTWLYLKLTKIPKWRTHLWKIFN